MSHSSPAAQAFDAIALGEPARLAELFRQGLDPRSRQAGRDLLEAASASQARGAISCLRLVQGMLLDQGHAPCSASSLREACQSRADAQKRVEALLGANDDCPQPLSDQDLGLAQAMLLAFTSSNSHAAVSIAKRRPNLLLPEARSPLGWACIRGFPDLVFSLLQAGADVQAPDSHGDTPLMLAACHSRSCFRMVEPASDPLATNRHGMSALMFAALSPHVDEACDTARDLLPKSDPKAIDSQGRSALMLALLGHSFDMADLLEPFGGPLAFKRDCESIAAAAREQGRDDWARRLDAQLEALLIEQSAQPAGPAPSRTRL